MPLEQGLATERRWFMTEAGRHDAMEAMEAFARQIESEGGSPWVDPETMRAWQEGTAGDPGEDDPIT
jgi:hypothetical protein